MELSQKSITGIQKFFLFQVPMNIQKDWKAKLESAYPFMLKYSKITVWYSFISCSLFLVKELNQILKSTYLRTYEAQNLFTEGAMKNEVLQFSLTPQISVTYLETSVFRCKQQCFILQLIFVVRYLRNLKKIMGDLMTGRQLFIAKNIFHESG